MVSFSGILGTGQVEDQKMIKVLLHWDYELTKKHFLMS